MKRRAICLAMIASLMLGGCFGSSTPFDRPWVDFGCDTPGECRVRGTLVAAGNDRWPQERLVLDDGRCLWVDLPDRFARNVAAWDGRRVAIRGQGVARVIDGPCADRGLLLYAERLSVRPTR